MHPGTRGRQRERNQRAERRDGRCRKALEEAAGAAQGRERSWRRGPVRAGNQSQANQADEVSMLPAKAGRKLAKEAMEVRQPVPGAFSNNQGADPFPGRRHLLFPRPFHGPSASLPTFRSPPCPAVRFEPPGAVCARLPPGEASGSSGAASWWSSPHRDRSRAGRSRG